MGDIIKSFDPGDMAALPTMQETLRRYAEVMLPWAERTAGNMLEEVNRRDVAGWSQIAGDMSRALRNEIVNAPTGKTFQLLMQQQVKLIQSIPLEAADRVHELTIRGLEDSSRAATFVEEIMRSGQVARSRAMTIARTEVSRSATSLTQARAEHVGSPGYVWTTSHDGDVRPSHKRMNGQIVAWDDPPTLDGMTGHAGCLPNCRCWAKVILPD